MAGNRTRISARLQPIAAALASAPGSASISSVLASISGSSTPAILPSSPSTITSTIPGAITTSQPQSSRPPRNPRRSANAGRTHLVETELVLEEPELVVEATTSATPVSTPPALTNADATPTSIQEGVNANDNDLISLEAEPLHTSMSTTVTPTAIESATCSDRSNGNTNTYNRTDTVSIATMAPSSPPPATATTAATIDPGCSSAQSRSSIAPSTATASMAVGSLPLEETSDNIRIGRALNANDNKLAEVQSTSTSSTSTSTSTPTSTSTTATTSLQDASPAPASAPTIDLTMDMDEESTLDTMRSMDNTESPVATINGTGSSNPVNSQPQTVQRVQSKQTSKSTLPLTVRLRLQAAEALERRKMAQSASTATRSTPPPPPSQRHSLSTTGLPRSSQSPQSPSPTPVASSKVQQEVEVLTEREQQERQQLLSNRATNPLDLPEIRSNIARFLTRRDIRSCLLVSEGWWQSFHPALWVNLRPVYRNVLGGTNDYPSAKVMHKNCHLIRTFEYNGHGTVLTSMVPSVHGQYKDEELTWRRSRAEEEAEENWTYVDDDVAMDGDIGMDLDESLSDFEKRIESRKRERLARKGRMKDIIGANKRQNELSRFLNDNTDYSKRYCQQLERLILTDKRFSREWGCHYKYWLRLMQLNSRTLQALELHYAIRSLDALRDFYTAAFALENVRDLVLVDNDIDAQKTKVFLETVCPRLRKLELRKVRIEFGPFPNQPAAPTDGVILAMPQMKSLTLIQVHARSSTFGLDFLKMCPNLVELDFRPQWGMAVKSFTDTLAEKLPGLTHLSFRMQGLSDLDVSSMIKGVPELQKLDISGCVFGMMAANNLTTRHLLSVTYLDIRSCAQVTGTLIQRVLGECRNLRVFYADHIRAKDIVNNSVYPDWACIGLKELTIDIRGCPQDRETTFKVYRQLAALDCLEYLDISRTTVSDIPATDKDGNANCLTLGLDKGLRLLKTLKQLHTLVYRAISDNDVGLVELQWMALAWPRLGNLGGKLVERKVSRFNPCVYPNTVTGGTSSLGSSFSVASGSGTGGGSGSGSSTGTSTGTGASTNGTGNQVGKRVITGTPADLLATTLRRLNLHRRIQVVPHPEDKISVAARKKRKLMLVGDSSDEERERERDRPRIGQLDPRYRLDFRD
ncbi:RNI-like protein [Linnemannia elongata AG-77]|uniref:RNI-like protein n=1 Tax=Linnemannia elongata AG-77 TaxID=1314771 RepID=A0A197JKZ7_9FUNG|nr:RNI-like protein [Linnemannia elongata AG-77]